jgi:hypothetical protein
MVYEHKHTQKSSGATPMAILCLDGAVALLGFGLDGW